MILMDSIFETPPLGGEPVPFQDLPQEQVTSPKPISGSASGEPKNKTLKIYLIGVGVLLVVVLIVLGIVLVLLSQQQAPVAVIQPTPTPTPTPIKVESALPQSIVDQTNQLESDVNNLDLQELDLSYPQLDWQVRY